MDTMEIVSPDERIAAARRKMLRKSEKNVTGIWYEERTEEFVFAFEAQGEVRWRKSANKGLMDATVNRNRLVRRGFPTTPVVFNEATKLYEFEYLSDRSRWWAI